MSKMRLFILIQTPPEFNYRYLLDNALDQALRGELTSAQPLNGLNASNAAMFPVTTGDVVFCNTTSNPTLTGYNFLMVTGSLYFNGGSESPVFLR